MKRVVAVLHFPVFQGPQNRMLRLAGPLRDRGFETTVVLPDEPGDASERLRAGGVDVVTIPLGRARMTRDLRPHLRFVFGFPGDVGRLRRILREMDADVVIAASTLNLHAGFAARLEGVPLIWQIVDSRTPRPLGRLALRAIDRLASAVMFWGNSVELRHTGGRALKSPVFYGHSAVDLDIHRPNADLRAATRSELGIPPDAPVVGMVANLNPQKGITTFLEAAELIHAQDPRTYFVEVGGEHKTHPHYVADIERLRDSSYIPANQLLFVGPSRETQRFYPAFDVQLITSVPSSEGIPTVALEGMACGVPIVATDAGSTGEFVVDGLTGFVTRPGDAAAIAERVLRLMTDDTLRKAFSERALRRAKSEFGLSAVADKHLEVFTCVDAG